MQKIENHLAPRKLIKINRHAKRAIPSNFGRETSNTNTGSKANNKKLEIRIWEQDLTRGTNLRNGAPVVLIESARPATRERSRATYDTRVTNDPPPATRVYRGATSRTGYVHLFAERRTFLESIKTTRLLRRSTENYVNTCVRVSTT